LGFVKQGCRQCKTVKSFQTAFSLPDVIIIKEGLYQVNESDLLNSCYGIFTAAGYGIYSTFEDMPPDI